MGELPATSLLVDARALGASGIGRYLREILARILEARAFGRITLLGNPAELHAFSAAHPSPSRVEVVPHAGSTYSLRSQVSWTRLRLAGKVNTDVAFFPHWDAPMLLAGGRSVVTVHDAIHFRVRDAFAPLRRAAARAVFGRIVHRAARIIVVSECTKADLLALEPGVAGKVHVIPNGVGAEFRQPRDDERVPLGVSEPYLLCVGAKKRHKNLVVAVQVLAKLLPQHPALRLVVAGPASSGWHEVVAQANELGVLSSLVDLPAVGEGELRALYRRCAVFLFPSRYEGFGLPLLEAMASGAPVVASNAASVPEVAGGAALLFEPRDAPGMAAAAHRLMTEPAFRQERVRSGRERAATFSWDRAALETTAVLIDVATR